MERIAQQITVWFFLLCCVIYCKIVESTAVSISLDTFQCCTNTATFNCFSLSAVDFRSTIHTMKGWLQDIIFKVYIKVIVHLFFPTVKMSRLFWTFVKLLSRQISSMNLSHINLKIYPNKWGHQVILFLAITESTANRYERKIAHRL